MEQQKAIDFIVEKMRKELPDSLKYHCTSHTLVVIDSVEHIATAEEVKKEDKQLLLTAAAYHDSGFLRTYKEHEKMSCRIAAENLPQFGFNPDQIRQIQGMIMATKVPQDPQNHLERVLCDADLDYLGGDEYDEISQALLEELRLNGINLDSENWLEVQIKFLEQHHYWTDYSREHRAPQKEAVLQQLKAKRKKETYNGKA